MKKTLFLSVTTLSMLLTGLSLSAVELKTDKQKFSYTMGVFLGKNIIHPDLEIDKDVLLLAISDVLDNSTLKISPEEMQEILNKYQQAAMKKRNEQAIENKLQGEAFLAKNKKRKGVTTLENGLQYEIIREGEGKSPQPDGNVSVHYRGTLIDGQEFDSSYARGEPATIPLGNVIPGWQEALPLMKEGGKWRLYIPADLAYGEQGAGDTIGPNSTLVFDIELLNVK